MSWAVVLGASSGFGEAAARAFAKAGYDIVGIHLDRRVAAAHIAELMTDLQATGQQVRFFNINAAADDRREATLDELSGLCAPQGVGVLLHSLAFGTLTHFVPALAPAPQADASDRAARGVTRKQLEMTLDVMANSLVYWTQGLVGRGLLAEGGRVYAMTSSGSHRVLPHYGPVSAAKAALESHCRQLAVELAPRGITVNAVMAGVTDTPALRKIPGHLDLMDRAQRGNPYGRLTTPQDVASCLVALAAAGTHWLTGNVLHIDGGEDISG
ncbi:MAG: SDR family oxidoreductase [Oligoflexia bacterium]|nr:SDR family oxidoreductase [Oligoflexia bacterium]